VALFGISLEGKPPYYGLIIGVVMGSVLAALFYWRVAIPQNNQLAVKDSKLAQLQARVREGRAAKEREAQFAEGVRLLQQELDKLLRILPQERNTAQLLRQVRTLAERGDFDLRLFDPGEFLERDFYVEWPITISLDGNYHNLALFFDRISRYPRILNVENLRIQAVGSQSTNRTIRANFVAKTFIYSEPPALDEGGGGGTP